MTRSASSRSSTRPEPQRLSEVRAGHQGRADRGCQRGLDCDAAVTVTKSPSAPEAGMGPNSWRSGGCGVTQSRRLDSGNESGPSGQHLPPGLECIVTGVGSLGSVANGVGQRQLNNSGLKSFSLVPSCETCCACHERPRVGPVRQTALPARMQRLITSLSVFSLSRPCWLLPGNTSVPSTRGRALNNFTAAGTMAPDVTTRLHALRRNDPDAAFRSISDHVAPRTSPSRRR